MSFDSAELMSTTRLVEAFRFISYVNSVSSTDPLKPDNEAIRALRGTALVILYGAVEHSTTVTVTAALEVISGHNTPSRSCKPPLHTLFHWNLVQATKDCSYDATFSKANLMFATAAGPDPLGFSVNPLESRLQNVGGNTLVDIMRFFGVPDYDIDPGSLGKLNHLRERRNAVAHGREAADKVGERFTPTMLSDLYDLVSNELLRFRQRLRDYCTSKEYVIT